MQLGEMIDYVCGICNQRDDATRALVRIYLGRRYQVIYDSFFWHDTEMTSQVDIDITNKFQLPDSMDRVVAIRCNGENFLDPVDINTLIQTDPGILERKGEPTCYREFITDTEQHYVQVFPIPIGAASLFLVGKRIVNTFNRDEHVSRIRNIDNVLLAFGVYDLLRRQRQWDKAGKALEEANALLSAAQNLEKGQANQPRLSKKLTVAGNSLAELTDQVCAITGDWSPQGVVLTKNFLRSNYQALWDMCNWSEATVVAKVNTNGPQIVLPSYFDRVISVRVDPTLGAISATQPSTVFAVNPTLFDKTGFSMAFSYLTPIGVALIPPVREKLSFYSTDADDKGKVFVKGELSGSEVSESVTLNGTTPVQTVNKYDIPLTVAKDVSKGDLVVIGYTSSSQLERILADERERKHIRLWLHQEPLTAQITLILGKRTMTPFAQDEDTTLLRDCGAALISAAAADMLAKAGNTAAAADQRQQAQDALKTLIDLETEQGSFQAQVIPYVDYVENWFEPYAGISKYG